MELNYYTLLIDWKKDGNFSPEFGDWDKDVVKQEQIDDYEGETYKIVTSTEPITAQVFKDMKRLQKEIDKYTKKQMSLIITSALFNMPIENFKSVQERHAKSLARLRKSELIEWVIKALKAIAQREETPKPSRKKTKIFAVAVWSEVERTVYVRANTAKQAENLIEECGYVEGENEFAETIMDEGGNIGATHLDNDSYATYEVEEKKRMECPDTKDRVITYYEEKKEENKSV